mgnify:CR=1 FL=1
MTEGRAEFLAAAEKAILSPLQSGTTPKSPAPLDRME